MPVGEASLNDKREAERRRKVLLGRLGRDLKKIVAVGAVATALVSGGLHAAILKLTGLEEVKTFIEVFAATAPLTTAVVLAILLWTLVPEERLPIQFRLFGTVLLVFGAALATGAIGVTSVAEHMRSSDTQRGVFQLFFATIGGFYRMYGPKVFWTSLIVGGVIAAAAMRVLRALQESERVPSAGG